MLVEQAFVERFFFSELRRRAARHFIKVEIKYTSLNRPYSSTKHHQHTPIHLIKTGAPQTKFLSTRKNHLPYTPTAGSLTKSSWSFLALALHQRLPLVLTALRTSWMLGVAFSNTWVTVLPYLPGYQNYQGIERPFCSSLGTGDFALHHLEKRDVVGSGDRELRPKY